MTFISLIVPCYNAEPFLGEALDSALRQTRPPDEIVIVDDGSTDGSAALAQGMAGPIRVVRRAHAGISATRNAGIEAGRGDLITFLDADDVWPRDSLERRLARWREAEIDYVFGKIACFDDRTGAAIGEPEAARLAGALLLRRSAFDEIGLFDTTLRTGEMLDWIGRADAAGYRAASIPDVVLRRRVHATNTTRDTDALHADYLKLLRRNISRRRG